MSTFHMSRPESIISCPLCHVDFSPRKDMLYYCLFWPISSNFNYLVIRAFLYVFLFFHQPQYSTVLNIFIDVCSEIYWNYVLVEIMSTLFRRCIIYAVMNDYHTANIKFQRVRIGPLQREMKLESQFDERKEFELILKYQLAKCNTIFIYPSIHTYIYSSNNSYIQLFTK